MVNTGGVLNTFDLAWADRGIGATQTPRRFLDYVIDGRSFYGMQGRDLISLLGWSVPAEDDRAAERMLSGSSDLDGRTAVAVCPEDGDLLCGAISAKIVIADGEVQWTDLGLSSYDHLAGVWSHEALLLPDLPQLRFDLSRYRAQSAAGRKPCSGSPAARRTLLPRRRARR
jgi:hypothetical protein